MEKLQAAGFMWEFTADRVHHFFGVPSELQLSAPKGKPVFSRGVICFCLKPKRYQEKRQNADTSCYTDSGAEVRWHKECTVRVRPLKAHADIGGLSPLSSYFQKSSDKKNYLSQCHTARTQSCVKRQKPCFLLVHFLMFHW